jgi:hypothetical protein
LSARAASYLGDPPSDVRQFPRYRLRAGTTIYRIHREEFGPWWFSDDGRGRFDLVLLPGQGTCYLAQRAVGGLLEAFKGMRMVSEEDMAARRECAIVLSRDLLLANCCVAAAGKFGVNAEIHTTEVYGKTQAWAAALRRAGFDGIRYFLRSDPSLKLIGYAIFDVAGEPPAHRWPHGRSADISESALAEAAKYGVRVAPTP